MNREKRSKIKAGICAVCAAMMLCCVSGYPVRAEENGSGTQSGENENVPAVIRLTIGDGQETPVFTAGEKASLEITIMNSGNTDAGNVRMEPVIQNASDWPFDMNRLNYGQTVGTIKAGSQAKVVWGGEEAPLTVREDVSGSPYKLVFHLTYDDGNKSYETDKYVFVKTKAKEKPADNGQTENNAQENESPGETPQEPVMDAGGVLNSEPVVTGGSADTGRASVPRVIVTGFETQPSEVLAGSNFKLIIHLKNTSSSTAVSNMLFDLQAPSSGTDAAAEAPAFLPASGSSSIYLDGIAAGGASDISIDLNARADLVKKPYSISMNMKYEDSSSAQYEAQSSLAIPITQKARFEFSKIQLSPESVAVGEEINVSCNLYNLGRVKMYNVKARFEGDSIEEQEQFIGNLDSGGTGNIDVILRTVAETGPESKCRLILSYEDDSGNVSTNEQTFELAVTAAQPVDEGMMDIMTEEEENGHGWIIAAGLVILILAGGAGAVVVVKQRKKKRIESEEEELSDEVERLTEDEL